ncbi:tRNA (adenosine(37)-N6)-threonylcarbamoyltransferase complex transferase subunit TsaD [Candidatus Poribacteria bacterium]|nr:tRNA (adenosine(37)-N6)-threonylcarbamoyltransferase complex transferase subunit TsaD [Candidatus Poribacteria bacterium]
MKILGIDTSCDETAAAVVENGRTVLSNVIASQIKDHQEYGGVVPELASRKHIEAINYIVKRSLDEANLSFNDIDAIAVTNRPGLIGALLVGVAAAKSLAYSHNLPLLGINHIEGHIYANYMVHETITFPHICLTVSGGHTLLVEVYEGWKYKVLGTTQDDAAGEVYDKVAKYLGLGFPGGRIIDELSQEGNPTAIDFPRPMLHSGDYQFSFSGIKTAVRYFIEKDNKNGMNSKIEDIAASFQAAVVDVLVAKTIQAAKANSSRSITLTGGVAANSELRSSLTVVADEIDVKVYYPPIKLCTDNGAMIAGIAYEKYTQGLKDNLSLNAAANGSLVDV